MKNKLFPFGNLLSNPILILFFVCSVRGFKNYLLMCFVNCYFYCFLINSFLEFKLIVFMVCSPDYWKIELDWNLCQLESGIDDLYCFYKDSIFESIDIQDGILESIEPRELLNAQNCDFLKFWVKKEAISEISSISPT